MYYIPGFYLWGICDILRRFFNCFGKSYNPMLTYFVASMMHPIFCYYFVIVLEMSLAGIAFAGILTNTLNLLLLFGLMLYD